MSRPVLSLLVALAGLGAVVGAGAATSPVDPPTVAAVDAVPVIGTRAVCPDVVQEPGRVTTAVSVGSVPAAGAAGAAGSVALTRGSSPDEPRALPLPAPGAVAGGLAGDVSGDAVVVTASGAFAAGLEVEQLTLRLSGAGRGLAGVRCSPAGGEAWFLGGSTAVGQVTTLVLVNPDPVPAVVDVTVSSAQGPADARPGRGLLVAGRSRQVIALDTLAPARDDLLVHVVATRGRVAAGLEHSRTDGTLPAGDDWVPLAGRPAADLVVPGVPQGPGARTLLLHALGPVAATVQVQATTGEGQFVPTGLDAVRVPAGTTVAVPVTDVVATSAAALRVRSDGPDLLAAVRVDDRQEGAPVQELAYAGAAGPLTGPALLTDVGLDPAAENTLLVSALEGDARVVVTPVAPVGDASPLPAPLELAVPGGTTVPLRLSTLLPAGASRRLAVEVRPAPGSGPVLAARALRRTGADGPYTTLLALQGAAQQVPRAAVVDDPAVGAGR